MTKYVDFNYYTTVYKGDMSETEFDKFVTKASAKIKNATFNRIDEDNIPGDVKFCACELLERIKKDDSSIGKSSESVGKWSVSYIGTDAKSKDAICEDIIRTYLSGVFLDDGTPILYRGC